MQGGSYESDKTLFSTVEFNKCNLVIDPFYQFTICNCHFYRTMSCESDNIQDLVLYKA